MLKMLLRVSFVFFFFFHLLEQIGRGREMIVSKYEGRYFSFEIISQSCIHSWNSNNKFVKMKFKFIQIREIKIRLERFFEKLYLY